MYPFEKSPSEHIGIYCPKTKQEIKYMTKDLNVNGKVGCDFQSRAKKF